MGDIDRWWGSRGWQELKNLTQAEIVMQMSNRFAQELGYKLTCPTETMIGGNTSAPIVKPAK